MLILHRAGIMTACPWEEWHHGAASDEIQQCDASTAIIVHGEAEQWVADLRWAADKPICRLCLAMQRSCCKTQERTRDTLSHTVQCSLLALLRLCQRKYI